MRFRLERVVGEEWGKLHSLIAWLNPVQSLDSQFPFETGGERIMCGSRNGRVSFICTHNYLTFANATTIAYRRKIARSLKILVVCNSSRVCKSHKITGISGTCWSSGICDFRRVQFLLACVLSTTPNSPMFFSALPR